MGRIKEAACKLRFQITANFIFMYESHGVLLLGNKISVTLNSK